MAWVKAEYANEFGVLSTWLAVLLPWSISYTTYAPPLRSIVYFFRFGLIEIQLRFAKDYGLFRPEKVREVHAIVYSGERLIGNFYVDLPILAVNTYSGTLGTAYIVYTAGAVVLTAAFVLSIAVYFREEWVTETLPYPYPRIAGVSLGVVTVTYGAATVWLFAANPPDANIGFTVPVGVFVLAALAYALLRADLCEAPT